MGDERRRAFRWLQREDVVCYFQGDRLGGSSANLSSGGMFLASTEELPTGSRVALLFRPRFAEETPIFLVARVVRREIAPEPGLGLQWLKAVTSASPLQLAGFLGRLLQIDIAGEIKEHADPAAGETVAEYVFPAGREAEKGRTQQDRVARARQALASLSVEVVHSDLYRSTHPEPPAPPPGPRPAAPRPAAAPAPTPPPAVPAAPSGPLTHRVDNRRVFAPCDLPATLMVEGRSHPARIRGLSTFGMFLETPLRLAPDAVAGVVFDLRTRSGDARLAIRCRVVGQKAAKAGWGEGLDLEIMDPGDPLGTALLKRYVRWLHFRAVSEDESPDPGF
ncbi:MAG: PilZ domain-containing protein [Deltaproteobacteria bacterium]|nr:PilZ domain-containing protein [Deltaproteobacteria bacterium]